ncbi:hypothetical protein [Flavobacterium coralii]|uniref:condensin complex protein MksE n=1 Tax=Flavobacterium coralii TaxID=2838017 RepID=UPI000C4D93B1|nr:hypothetical protein [Flavobacterium sp.]|tara:strand:+ start:2457 stop:3104 length:648 start_codon:yes stop_codon:yes gene_type:complete
MEDGSQKITVASFLFHEAAEDIFAQLDYALKDGMHIQREGKQVRQFNFIEANEESLVLYYQKFFNVTLLRDGEDPNAYYYLDFYGNDRGNISDRHRHIMKSEFVLIGFIIYKIIYIDWDIELDSVQKLKDKIRIDYEDHKPGLYRLIAKSKNTNPSNINDTALDNTIQSALEEFRKIGWISLNKDDFSPLPAFKRLLKIYEEQILNIDETLNKLR